MKTILTWRLFLRGLRGLKLHRVAFTVTSSHRNGSTTQHQVTPVL